MTAKKTAGIIIKLAIVIALFYYIGHTVITDWDAVRSFDWRIDPLFMALSCIGFITAYATLAGIWRIVLESFGYRIQFRSAWAIYFIGNLGRYIPGKVWTVAGVAYMGNKVGIPPVITGTAAVCAQAYAILSSFVFFILFFIFINTALFKAGFLWAVPVPVILILIFMVPRNLERMLNVILTRLGKEEVAILLSIGTAVKITFLYLCSWFVFGFAFWLFVSSIAGAGTFNLLYLTGVYAVSYVTGYLALFAPGGIGVREGIMSILLTSVISPGVAAVVAVLSRLMVTVVELLCVGIVFFQKGAIYGKEKKETRT